MKKLFSACLLIMATISLAAAQGNSDATSKAEQEVRSLERQWLDAYEKRDVAAMEKIVASDFTATFPGGRMQTKAQILKFIGSPRKPGSPTPKFSSEDVQAHVYGDTVVLTGKLVTIWPGPNDTSKKQEARYTDTYVKRDGAWQVVASAMTNIESGPTP